MSAIYLAALEQIQRDVGLVQWMVPSFGGESFVHPVHNEDEVTLERLDGPFRRFASVVPGRHHFTLEVLLFNCIDKFIGHLVVNSVHDWLETTTLAECTTRLLERPRDSIVTPQM